MPTVQFTAERISFSDLSNCTQNSVARNNSLNGVQRPIQINTLHKEAKTALGSLLQNQAFRRDIGLQDSTLEGFIAHQRQAFAQCLPWDRREENAIGEVKAANAEEAVWAAITDHTEIREGLTRLDDVSRSTLREEFEMVCEIKKLEANIRKLHGEAETAQDDRKADIHQEMEASKERLEALLKDREALHWRGRGTDDNLENIALFQLRQAISLATLFNDFPSPLVQGKSQPSANFAIEEPNDAAIDRLLSFGLKAASLPPAPIPQQVNAGLFHDPDDVDV